MFMSKEELENRLKKIKAGDVVAIVKESGKEGYVDYIEGTIHSVTEKTIRIVLWNPKGYKVIRKGLIRSITILEGEK